jgi:hypothetical protein
VGEEGEGKVEYEKREYWRWTCKKTREEREGRKVVLKNNAHHK